MAVLYPCYYLPFYKYVDMFAGVIRSRDRGKGSLGKCQDILFEYFYDDLFYFYFPISQCHIRLIDMFRNVIIP